MRCHKMLQDREDPNRWKELRILDRIKFADATLNKLVWKHNPDFRSYKPLWGEKKREEHAR